MAQDRPALAWCETLSDAIDQFFDVDDGQQWQLEKLRQMVTEIGDQAVVGDKPATVELSLADIRRLLADRLQGAPSRSQFFRGGITVSSLTPLRWLPFRVICLLGLDEAGTSGTSGTDGDDLAAAAPLVGDREPAFGGPPSPPRGGARSRATTLSSPAQAITSAPIGMCRTPQC